MHALDNDKNGFSLDRRVFFLGTASALTLGTTACGGGGGSFFFPSTGTGTQTTATATQQPQTTTTTTDAVDTTTA